MVYYDMPTTRVLLICFNGDLPCDHVKYLSTQILHTCSVHTHRVKFLNCCLLLLLLLLLFILSGDLLNNYCVDDWVATVARFLYACVIMLTFPIEIFVCREVG